MQHSIHTKKLTPPRVRLLTAVALLGMVLAAGCGGGSPSPTVAQLGSASSAAAGGGEAGSGQLSRSAVGADVLAFAKCMRASGVPNFPDPKPGGGFLFHASAGSISSPVFKAAQAKCHKLLPGGGPPGPGTTTSASPQTLARFLKIARCMRRQGVYDFPDPRTSVPSRPFGSGNGVISDIEGVILIFPSTIDQQSPTFTRAAGACAFPLHNH